MSADPWLPTRALVGGMLVVWLARRPLVRLLAAVGFRRRNFEGREAVTGVGILFALLGAAAAAFLPAGAAAGPWLLTALGFGALGLFDDHCGSREVGGLRGHLSALRRGKVTTGSVKLLGGTALAIWAAAWGALPRGDGWPVIALDAALIAGAGNALNLTDTRPLRALKVWTILAIPLAAVAAGRPGFGGGAAAVLSWLLGGLMPYAALEARREAMLGDAGANALGAMLGLAATLVLPLWLRGGALGLILLFHGWTETRSLSRWIETHPWARRLDAWGWRNGGR